MVKNPGTQARTGAIKLLNVPTPVGVRADPAGRPAAIATRSPLSDTRPRGHTGRLPQKRSEPATSSVGTSRYGIRTAASGRCPHPGPLPGGEGIDGLWQAVVSIDDRWKVNEEWWRGQDQRIERMYYSVLLENGQRITVFHDMTKNEWFRQA